MYTDGSTPAHWRPYLIAITLLMALAVLPQLGQAQYIDMQRQARVQTETQSGSDTVRIIQGLKGGSVAIVQIMRAEFVIPQAVLDLIDHAGTSLGLHSAEGVLIEEIVTEKAVTELPTAELEVGTYLLTAVSNLFSKTHALHIE